FALALHSMRLDVTVSTTYGILYALLWPPHMLEVPRANRRHDHGRWRGDAPQRSLGEARQAFGALRRQVSNHRFPTFQLCQLWNLRCRGADAVSSALAELTYRQWQALGS